MQRHYATSLYIDQINSPLGPIVVVTDDEHVHAINFGDRQILMIERLQARYPALTFTEQANPLGMRERLQAYLKGDRNCFHDLTYCTGGTAFQRQVWNALQHIPYGKVVCYGEVAAQLGKPKAARAVGMANAWNPIAIAIPCHRVIGANAKLTGYAGGIERKRWLLHHEGINLSNS